MKRRENNFRNVVKITASCLVLILAVFLLAPAVRAADSLDKEMGAALATAAGETGLQKSDPRAIAGRIIKIFLGLLGAIALSIVIYAGFLYMTAGGDPAKVKKAQDWLKNAVIGLVIIISSYSLVTYIFNVWLGMKQPGAGYTPAVYEAAKLVGQSYKLSNGAFGEVIQNHYPLPEQKDVARNTGIVVSFKIPVNPASVMDEKNNANCPKNDDKPIPLCGNIKAESIRVYKCADVLAALNQPKADCQTMLFSSADLNNVYGKIISVPGYILLTQDNKTVIFNPYGDSKTEHLGDAKENVPYLVYLTTSIAKKEKPKESVFSSSFPDYKWRFTTGTTIDLTPPKISSVIPPSVKYPDPGNSMLDESGLVYLNQIVVINFDEPVLPPLTQQQDCLAADKGDKENDGTGIVQLVASKIISGCDTPHVPGDWTVGINGYRTVQFIAKAKCANVEVNSCGEPVKCLPEKETMTSMAIAATVDESGFALPTTGVVDLAFNSLDGDADGTSEGPGDKNPSAVGNQALLKDNYFWSFQTGESLDLIPPVLSELSPSNATPNIQLDLPLKATFNEEIEPYSVDVGVKLSGIESGIAFDGWYDANMATKVEGDEEVVDMKTIKITHRLFVLSEEGKESPKYAPSLASQIKDLRQNCFSPTKNAKSGGAGSGDCSGITVSGTSCCPDKTNYQLTPLEKQEECVLPWEQK